MWAAELAHLIKKVEVWVDLEARVERAARAKARVRLTRHFYWGFWKTLRGVAVDVGKLLFLVSLHPWNV